MDEKTQAFLSETVAGDGMPYALGAFAVILASNGKITEEDWHRVMRDAKQWVADVSAPVTVR